MDDTFSTIINSATTNSLNDSSLISVALFIIIMIIIGTTCAIRLIISSNPSEKIVRKAYKNYNSEFFFFYKKATAYRMLFSTHIFLSNALKIFNACTTFIVVYCAMIDESYILLFSMLSALGNVIALTIPFDNYAKIYVEAARELENAIQSESISKKTLLDAYNRAEKIIQERFM